MILGATLSVFALVGIGAVARQARWLSEEADRGLLILGINLLLPCLIFTVVADNAALKQAGNLLLSPSVGFGTFALGLAVLLNLLGVTRWLHQYAEFLLTAIRWLGDAAVPMLLVVVGATMADQFRAAGRGNRRNGAAKAIAWACLLRLGLLPVAFLLIAVLVPAGLVELRSVIVVEAAMPSAVFSVLLARLYGGDPGTALRVVLSTSIVSLVTIPLWISAGVALFGLPVGG